jgi:hypothetical protein
MQTILKWTTPALLLACGGKNPGAYEVGASGGTANAEAVAEADSLWKERDDRGQLIAALAKYEEAYAADPNNRHVAVQLTRGYYFLGDAHESELEAKATQWQTSIEWGKRCVAINADFTALLEKGDEDEISAIEKAATKDDVPCLYWTATSLGKWAKDTQSLSTLLKHKDTVKKYIETVDRLDPEYYHGAASRYWGAYYAALPSFAGRDYDMSAAKFAESLELAPHSLSTKVLWADRWAVGTQDHETFDRLLCEVLNADPEFETIGPENRAEQAKARALMDNRIELFVDGGEAAECVIVPIEPAAPEAEEAAADDGEASEEASAEGEATEGEATEGEATEGEATEGEATEGEATEGEATTEE